MGVGLMAVASALAVGSTLLPAAAPIDDASCSWRLTARVLYQEVRLEATARAVELRNILEDAGVGAADFLPSSCTDGTAAGAGGGGSGDGSSGRQGTGSSGSSVGSGGGSPRPGSGGAGAGGGTGATGAGANGNCPTTAADALGWGTPNREDDFEGGVDGWGIYDGAGHAGNGTRSPAAITTADGILTITGTPDGQSGGMAWNPGQMYGRWEGCAQSPPGDPDLHSLFLLWPDAENWPEGGETDFMEISDPTRQTVEGFFHYGADNQQEHASVDIDATQWHAFAVEWTPQGATYFVDGEEWWSTTDTSILPPGPQHLTIQLDNFGNPQQETQMHVDWVRQYSLDDTGGTGIDVGVGVGVGGAGSSQNGSRAGQDTGGGRSGGNADDGQDGGEGDQSGDRSGSDG
ncbi:glycoside hydrolase family 16 protein [Pseudonocardia sp. WMMC193]|uniref:glycoside hydrolase family 16 protein n=1 Tax=Pseudonocardia sp. WMMC193 TaxID=2911965 RepID=UPI001F3535CE|nr:glycoside hydrolase family 16 protein [Pseudonocardia sp. WMMC193]MCF7547153.1 glycoside hydrolase family 16 protein [Pseudonocardia sp. WMMC193]MCF7547247.1 glycoside hydrolase family 16 protein [Pseudonocardia sp. WMMC193]MCF7547269.1 glycoside hydrolase family 16 protein [Pseudonocardia sp. WMMC193]